MLCKNIISSPIINNNTLLKSHLTFEVKKVKILGPKMTDFSKQNFRNRDWKPYRWILSDK